MKISKDLGGMKVVTYVFTLIALLCAVAFVVGVNAVSHEDTEVVDSDTSIEADMSQLVSDIKVDIDGELISYKDLKDVEVGTYDCAIYYENDIVTSKSAYIVNSFDKEQTEVTYTDGDFVKITLPYKGE